MNVALWLCFILCHIPHTKHNAWSTLSGEENMVDEYIYWALCQTPNIHNKVKKNNKVQPGRPGEVDNVMKRANINLVHSEM